MGRKRIFIGYHFDTRILYHRDQDGETLAGEWQLLIPSSRRSEILADCEIYMWRVADGSLSTWGEFSQAGELYSVCLLSVPREKFGAEKQRELSKAVRERIGCHNNAWSEDKCLALLHDPPWTSQSEELLVGFQPFVFKQGVGVPYADCGVIDKDALNNRAIADESNRWDGVLGGCAAAELVAEMIASCGLLHLFLQAFFRFSTEWSENAVTFTSLEPMLKEHGLVLPALEELPFPSEESRIGLLSQANGALAVAESLNRTFEFKIEGQEATVSADTVLDALSNFDWHHCRTLHVKDIRDMELEAKYAVAGIERLVALLA